MPAETVTAAPLAVPDVMAWVPVVPTVTLPKFSGAGVTDRPAVAVVVPVPLNGTFELGPKMKMPPALVPADGGVKVDCNVTLCPALKVMGDAGR